MLCYRDRCYCSREDCTNKLCDRRITENVKRDAARVGLPIDVADLGDVACYTTCDNEKSDV
jgi:hypothetical protein